MTPHYLRLALVGAGLILLTACGGGSPLRGIETLGATFVAAFGQGPNDTPLDVANADLVLQLAQDPFEL